MGLIILPFIASLSDYTVLSLSYRNRVGNALDVALGTAMQVSLFLIPSITIYSWITDRPFTLAFHLPETVCMLISVVVVDCQILDGKANYLKGSMCVGM